MKKYKYTRKEIDKEMHKGASMAKINMMLLATKETKVEKKCPCGSKLCGNHCESTCEYIHPKANKSNYINIGTGKAKEIQEVIDLLQEAFKSVGITLFIENVNIDKVGDELRIVGNCTETRVEKKDDLSKERCGLCGGGYMRWGKTWSHMCGMKLNWLNGSYSKLSEPKKWRCYCDKDCPKLSKTTLKEIEPLKASEVNMTGDVERVLNKVEKKCEEYFGKCPKCKWHHFSNIECEYEILPEPKTTLKEIALIDFPVTYEDASWDDVQFDVMHKINEIISTLNQLIKK